MIVVFKKRLTERESESFKLDNEMNSQETRLKSNKKDYHLQAKRKAYQEVTHSAGTGIDVKTSEIAQSQPEDPAKMAEAVKVTNKGQNAKVSDVEAGSAKTPEPEAIETAAN